MTTTPRKELDSTPDIDLADAGSRLTPADQRVKPRPRGWTALLLRLHFYAGLFVGPFLLAATLSGGLYAIAPSIEQVIYADQLNAEGRGPARPVAEQIRAAQAVRPDLTVTAVRPGIDPGETTRVLFDDPTVGESERRAVFVDPSTAQSQGELVVYGSSGALPVRTWIDQLHRNLHLGEPGRLYSEFAASWMWLIALAGLGLWVSRYRRMSQRRPASARLLTVDRSASGRARTLNWHGAVGVWIAVGLLFLSATGLTWSTYAGAHVDELRSALSWTTPTVTTALGESSSTAAGPAESDHGDHGSAQSHGHDRTAGRPRVDDVDRVLQAARAAGIEGKVEVTIPSDADTAFTVAQTRQPWVMSNNTVAVDGTTGTVTDRLWFSDWPLAAKLAAWGIQLHMGLLFGLANQLALLALAVALATVIVRGYLMWWRRRPTRGRPFGRPPARGGIRRVPVAVAGALLLAAVAIGWFIPLLGISLAAFMAIDLTLGAVSSTRRRARDTGEHADDPAHEVSAGVQQNDPEKGNRDAAHQV